MREARRFLSGATLVALGLICLPEPARAGLHDTPGICRTGALPARGELERRLSSGIFRIFFTANGPNAVANNQDRNQNGTPDVIDDLSTQVNAAHQLFSDVLRLREPLRQPRYALAKTIDIYVFALDGPRGLAFDEVVNRKATPESIEQGCALQIFIDKDIDPALNVTPAHELFHLYQYGYTPFKSGWFLEGMARWMDEAFRSTARRQTISSSSPQSCSAYFRHAYQASAYWAKRGQTSGQPIGYVVTPPPLRNQRYLNGMQVIETPAFEDKLFAQEALHRLQVLANKISAELGHPPHNWPESLQRSTQFDHAICQAIEQGG